MSRKIFISFLGITGYTPIIYLPEDMDIQNYEPLKFVQEATILEFCKDFSKEDKIFIFTTDKSLVNWNGDVGLEARLKNLNLKAQYDNIQIPEGESEKKIWEIFTIVFDKLKENDKLTFDITHGFRSLPMLNMVLISYAKLLKNITVSGIYYGAFDAKSEKDSKKYAPIWNLLAFSKLQDWTDSANIFLTTGNASSFVKQITTEQYTDIKKSISKFSQFIYVNRGMDIYKGEEMIKLKENLSSPIEDNDPATSALKPILKKIESEFKHYEKDSVLNGFIAVRWCINNGLFQQAATLLEEFITSFVMIGIGENDIKDKEKRTTISAALAIGNVNEFKYMKSNEADKVFCDWQKEFVEKVGKYKFKKDFYDLSNKVKNSIRDDINHSGFRKTPRTFEDFENSLKKRYKEVRKLIKTIKGIDIPEL